MSEQNEEWRDIPGWEGHYQVSDQGRVKSCHRVINMSDGRTRTVREHIMKPATSGNPKQRQGGKGYAAVCLARGRGKRYERVNRLVLAAFVGIDESLPLACHRNGDSNDNRLSNLYWGDHHTNAVDAINHGVNHKSNKTHCIWGHEYSPENTYVTRPGHRACRECRRARERERYAARVAGVAA